MLSVKGGGGGAERLIRTVTSVISKIVEEQEEWDQHLAKVLFPLRASTHKTTGFSPVCSCLAGK